MVRLTDEQLKFFVNDFGTRACAQERKHLVHEVKSLPAPEGKSDDWRAGFLAAQEAAVAAISR